MNPVNDEAVSAWSVSQKTKTPGFLRLVSSGKTAKLEFIPANKMGRLDKYLYNLGLKGFNFAVIRDFIAQNCTSSSVTLFYDALKRETWGAKVLASQPLRERYNFLKLLNLPREVGQALESIDLTAETVAGKYLNHFDALTDDESRKTVLHRLLSDVAEQERVAKLTKGESDTPSMMPKVEALAKKLWLRSSEFDAIHREREKVEQKFASCTNKREKASLEQQLSVQSQTEETAQRVKAQATIALRSALDQQLFS